jgi:alkanesulfonate monooxygenase SsuD/methylene tetrahydromethanopterin reductase-like flavin-dependent oxidoreductase (luciferase family)
MPSRSAIRLTSATTLLGVADPVRVYEGFATLDLISRGRAEIIAGRSAFVEPFRLFGYDTADYDALLAEKLGLLLDIRSSDKVTWRGRFRAARAPALAGRPVPRGRRARRARGLPEARDLHALLRRSRPPVRP